MKHVNTFGCPLCDEKLKGTHPDLVVFANLIRSLHQDAHISWGLRGKEDQEAFLRRGTSKAAFGESPHNFGLAVDFFRLTQGGGASFDPVWYRNALAPLVRANSAFSWGGDWKSFKDLPHVELANWRSKIPSKS